MTMGELVPRVYATFRGVDFRTDEVNLQRSPDSLNVWKDYKEVDSIRTRPGMELLERFNTPVWGVFFYTVGNDEMMIVHSGTTLYRLSGGKRTQLYTGLMPARSQSFVYNNIFYFKDGINYLQYDGEEIGEVVGYVPTTTIGRKPEGGGTQYEDVNMLSSLRMNSFLADGESVEYHLDTTYIDSGYTPVVRVNDSIVDNFDVNYAKGLITFAEAPEAPLTDGQDNVLIKFKKTVAEHRGRINNCRLLQVFDNRVFFSGNPNYPNTVWHSSLNDPSYCSDLDYYNEGLDLAAVTGLVAGNNALWIFKEPSQANTAIFYHNPTLDSQYGKVYPSTHSSVSTGCIGAAINFNDDIAYFSDRGMEAINGDVTTEQVLAHRSTLIDRKLLSEESYRDMILEEWEGYLLVFVGNRVYLADSRGIHTIENHVEYEWFYWELEKEITCTIVHNGILYLGTPEGIYTLTDNEANMESYWITPVDKFMNPQYMKTTNKKGCVVEATGDVTLSVKTNKTEWREVSTHIDVTDYFAGRVKEKKWKDIQLKFSSNTRFSLVQAVLEAYVGGYIKR